jgi:hypothetical protein
MIVTIEQEDYPQLLKPYSANIEDGSYNLEVELTVEWIDGGFFDEYEDED